MEPRGELTSWSIDDKWSKITELVIEFTEQSLLLPDEEFEQIAGEIVKGCEVRPTAHKLAILIVDIVRDKRSEVLARTEEQPIMCSHKRA